MLLSENNRLLYDISPQLNPYLCANCHHIFLRTLFSRTHLTVYSLEISIIATPSPLWRQLRASFNARRHGIILSPPFLCMPSTPPHKFM